jgi:hypothetical protein
LTCPLPAPIFIGSPGAGPNQFNGLSDVVFDNGGTLYALDSNNKRVEVFTSGTVYSTQWNDLGGFVAPSNICYSATSSRLYVLDTNVTGTLGVIKPFTTAGLILPTWVVPGSSRGLAVDSASNVYVGAVTVVIRYDQTGFGPVFYYNHGINLSPFTNVQALAVDSSNNLFVATGATIQKFDAAGHYLTEWGSAGTGTGQFFNVAYMRTDSSNFLYVSDDPLMSSVFNGRVQRFDNNGNFVCYLQIAGDELEGLAVDSVGNLFVADTKNGHILEF